MTDTDYADLIRRLREEAQAQYEHDVREIPNSSHYLPLKQRTEWKAANAIAALAKQIKTSCDEDRSNPEHGGCPIAITEYQRGLRDGERKGLERAKAEIAQLKSEFRSEQYAVGQPQSSFHERFACKLALERIDALITSERQSDGDKV